MVKGVNKSVIEICDTGNKHFSKIILYIAPEYSELSSKKLTKEAFKYLREININNALVPLRRKIRNEQRRRRLVCMLGSVACAVILAGLIVFL